jgi:hypothetical protein
MIRFRIFAYSYTEFKKYVTLVTGGDENAPQPSEKFVAGAAAGVLAQVHTTYISYHGHTNMCH